jgi:ribonuclease BN (tRNA processing enzyme)
MRIKILGTRGQIKISKPGYQKHSGILIDKEILLDVGEKEYLDYNPKIIFITHLHPDHAFFVSGKTKIDIPMPVYAPGKSPKLQTIRILDKRLLFDNYRITAIPVIHSLKVKSQGYLIEKGSKRLFYSGDIVDIDKKFYHQLSNLDAVITEASFIRRGGVIRRDLNGHRYGHAGIPDLIKLFSGVTNRIIFTHFGSWFVRDVEAGKEKFRRLENEYLKLEVACDGKEFLI